MTTSSSDSSEEVDFNIYRKEYECTEHWNLRKSFMVHHWDQIDNEEEILCCAQLFVNIEFLGCRYAKEIMEKIEKLSNEVPQIRQYRKLKKDRLKRTFVTAKDAIKAKYSNAAPKFIPQPVVNVAQRQNTWANSVPIDINYIHKLGDDWNHNERTDWNKYVAETSMIHYNPSIKLSESQRIDNLKSLLRDVIVFESDEENDQNYCLNKTSACMNKIGKLEVKFDADSTKYFYIFNGQIIAEGNGESKKVAKKAADENFLKVLKDNCYTIRSKVKFYSGEDVIKKTGNKEVSPINNQIQEDNVGFRLLSKLGWKGGSLGTNGIVDPIKLEIKINRLGLGAENANFDVKYFRNLLQNFKQNHVEYDLIFSPEFNKEERAQIHQIAAQLNLRTKSYGKSSSRHLVISTRISPQVLREKLIEGDEYLREKYELIPPPFVKTVKPRLL